MGKSRSAVTGYHYRPAFHQGLCRGPFDAYLEWRVADKTAWSGELTASGTININAPFLFGGDKDQGGVQGTLQLMFGEAEQMPNGYLASTFGPQQPAWRGHGTLVWQGGRFGANNPYAQKNSSKVRKILEGWDGGACWYSEKAEIVMTEGGGDGEPGGAIWLISHPDIGGGRYVTRSIGLNSWTPAAPIPLGSGPGLLFSRSGTNDVLGVGITGSAVSRDAGITWVATNPEVSSVGASNCYQGGYWHAAGGSFSGLRRAAVGDPPLIWEYVGAGCFAERVTVMGSRLIAGYSGGIGYQSVFISNNSGADWDAQSGGFGYEGHVTVGSLSASTDQVAMFGAGDGASMLLVSPSGLSGTWVEQSTPFTGEIGVISGKYDERMALWFAWKGTRLAYGAIGSLVLLEHEFPHSITDLASDGVNLLVVGAGGMAQATTDFEQWDSIEVGVSEGILNVIALNSVDPVPPGPSDLIAMNPAHILVYSRTDSERGREPFANINEASLSTAADQLHSEGFGLCTEYDPASESPAEFETRICRVIAGSFDRSLTDGQWYLDLARSNYDIDALPVLSDDDILDFKQQLTTLDRAVNSLSVRYFEPDRKESIITPAVRALGLIRKFGEIHETLNYPEIPIGALAARVAERELRMRVTPQAGFNLITTPKTYAWRQGTYFRLQAPKRGIADMVCIVGQKKRGTLKSGAIDMAVAQDIYSLPDTTYIEVEPGVDTRPPRRASPISRQRAFEAPYFELAGRLPRAELALLPADAGYVMAVASDPAAGRDFTMTVAPDGGEYQDAGAGYWCPTALAFLAVSRGQTLVPLASPYRFSEIQLGAPALWDGELVRVDAKDPEALTVTLGRGCADTVAVPHAVGSRLWFYDPDFAQDVAEYSDGETVQVKLLSNTGSDRLAPARATPMDVTFDQRAARPYPPANLEINGEVDPATAIGDLVLTWSHRDRLLQADQLVDDSMASIGPEPGTTYTARYFLGGVLQDTQAGIAGTTTTYTPEGAGLWRIELESVRDGLTSWQMHVRELVIGAPLLSEEGALITTEDDQPILME